MGGMGGIVMVLLLLVGGGATRYYGGGLRRQRQWMVWCVVGVGVCGGFWICAFALDFRGGGCVIFPPKFPPSSIFSQLLANFRSPLSKYMHFLPFSG